MAGDIGTAITDKLKKEFAPGYREGWLLFWSLREAKEHYDRRDREGIENGN